MIKVITGRPGAGKSLAMADLMVRCIRQNYRVDKKQKRHRLLWSNMALSPKYEKRYKNYLRYWTDPAELVQLKDCDVFWDEIATHMDATQWEKVPLELKRFLQQHRKLGVRIFGTTQDFAMIDKSFRRMTHEVLYLTKLVGSRDPSPTRPPVKNIWGLIIIRKIDPIDYDEEDKKHTAKGFIPMLITKRKVELFDTRQIIKVGKYPPLQHIVRECLQCGKVHTIHR